MDDRAPDSAPPEFATEAELRAALEGMAPGEAEAVLSQLASALFPSGVGDASQLTWPEGGNGHGRPSVSVRTTPIATAESKLRNAELRYRTLIEQIPAVTFMAVLGEGENEIYVSPHIEALLGFTQREWLENPFLWYSQLHPEDRELWHREFARGCRTGGPFRAECRFLSRDGRIVWVHGEARLVKDDLGRPLFLQGVAFDITESKRAEAQFLRQAVRTTEARYRDLVEQVGMIFWEADPETPGFAFVSPGAEQVLGFPAEQWLADPNFLISRVHPQDRDAVTAAWEQARTRLTGSEEFEFRALREDGSVAWLHQKIHVHRVRDEGPRVLGVIFDVTDRKHAEEVLRENESRLRAETDIRRTLHRIGSALASELDLERVVQLASDEATALTGAEFGAFFYNAVDEKGESSTLYTVSGVPRETFPADSKIVQPTFENGVVRLDDVTTDPRYGRSAPFDAVRNRHLPVRSYLAVPIVSRTGAVLGGMFFGHSRPGVFTQEHERLVVGIGGWTALAIDNASLYQAAEKAREAAESANRAKDEFLATMSHELRTPLNAVLGWTMILRSNGDDARARARALDTIERNARAQAQIIEDLLDVSRIVTGKLGLQVTTVDLAAVIDASLESVRLGATSKQIAVHRHIDRSAAVVTGDAHRLQQVVSNLLTNAVKFTPAGGRIDVRLERAANLARITVADTGEGIARDFLPFVFERFRQADGSASRVHGGLGLGLAIVRHLVELHGGTVRALSAGRGQGATFTVEIPLLDAHAAAAMPDATTDDKRTIERRLDGVRVLIVDDEPDSREMMMVMLERAGATVVTTDSASEALAMIDAVAPHVLVSDIGLPTQDGYEFIRVLRDGRSRMSRVPAVAVTAYARPEDRTRALAAGFHVHVSKPIVAHDLIASIAHLATTSEP